MNSAYIELTTTCNLRCRTCFNSSGERIAEIPANSLGNIIETLTAIGVGRFIFAGGEPLLYSSFSEVLRIIETRPDLQFVTSTNGTVPNHNFTRAFHSCDNLNLQVSLDGSNEKINALTRGAKTFDKVMGFLSHLRTDKKKPRLKMVISKYNLTDVEDFYRLALSLKCIPEFAFVSKLGRAQQNWNDIALTDSEKVGVVKLIDQLNMETRTGINIPLCASSCPLADNSAERSYYIDVHGDVFPCQTALSDMFKLGNVFSFDKDSFDARFSQVQQLAKTRENVDIGCASCFLGETCKRGCMAEAYFLCGDPLANDGNCGFRKKLVLQDIKSSLFAD